MLIGHHWFYSRQTAAGGFDVELVGVLFGSLRHQFHYRTSPLSFNLFNNNTKVFGKLQLLQRSSSPGLMVSDWMRCTFTPLWDRQADDPAIELLCLIKQFPGSSPALSEMLV